MMVKGSLKLLRGYGLKYPLEHFVQNFIKMINGG